MKKESGLKKTPRPTAKKNCERKCYNEEADVCDCAVRRRACGGGGDAQGSRNGGREGSRLRLHFGNRDDGREEARRQGHRDRRPEHGAGQPRAHTEGAQGRGRKKKNLLTILKAGAY